MIIIGLIIGALIGYTAGTVLAINQICELTDDNVMLADELRKIKGEDNGKET